MVYIPRRRLFFQYSREWAVKGAAHRRFRRLALDGLPRLCYFPGKRRGYILQSRPLFPRLGKGVGFGLNFLIKISEV